MWDINLKLNKIKDVLSSVKVKLFLTLSTTVLLIILFLIIVNNFALEKFYLYKKQNTLKSVYESLNDYYKTPGQDNDLQTELEKLSIKNNFDILIKDNNGINLYTTNKNFSTVIGSINDILDKVQGGKELESNDNFTIKKQRDSKNGLSYMMLSGKLENGYFLYIRIPLNSIQDSVSISNNFLLMMAGFTILIASIMVTIVSKKFTEPILELNNIAKKMSNLDFSQKYKVTNARDEINDLGRSINTMSDKLERTIKQLRNSNIELERDIEEKSKIDEMRKSFVNTMIHELKRPVQTLKMCIAFLNNKSMRTDERAMDEVVKDSMFELDNLSAYLAKVRDMTRADYEHTPLHIRTFDLRETVDKLIRLVNVPTNKKVTIHPHYEMKSTLVTADPVHIANIISNLIENAIKYSGKEVRIDLSCIQKEHTLTIQITDNGIGIPPAEQSKVFDKFYRGNHIPDRNIPGIGLGLSYVKLLTEAHHGHVSLTSQPSKGTTFSIVLPQ